MEIKKEFKSVAEGFKGRFTFRYLQDFLLDDIPQKISELSANDLIYMLALNRDKAGHFISYTDGIQMIRQVSEVQSTVPGSFTLVTALSADDHFRL